MPTVHKLSERNQRRTRNLNARAQKDARLILKRGSEGGAIPVRSLLRLKARVICIGLIKADLDNKGHHEFSIEAALKCGSRELTIPKLAHVVAVAEHALQSHLIYHPCNAIYNNFVEEHEPEGAKWQFHIVYNMNRALLELFLKKRLDHGSVVSTIH